MYSRDRDIFIIIPAYREAESIGTVLTALHHFGYSIIVVDDGSDPPLRSKVIGPCVYYLQHRINLGQGAAIQTGIEFALSAGAHFLITFDADGQHQAADIQPLLQPLLEGKSDVSFGSRFLKGSTHNMPAGRRVFIRIAQGINFLFTGLMLTDAHNGLRAMNRKAAEKINITENGMAHASEILFQVKKHKLRYVEVPVNIRYTEYSLKKGQKSWAGFRILFDLLLNKIFR